MVKLAFLFAMIAGAAQAAPCRLALALAMDVSSSVDAQEDALQRGGLARALAAPSVQEAFFATDAPVALAIYEWSGRYHQDVVLDWTMIQSPADLARASQTVGYSVRRYAEFPTAMGLALGFGAELLARAPDCLSQTLDIAGDGQNNEGPSPQVAYRTYDFDAITVNGLVVNAADFEGEVALIAFYQTQVLHGPGAFMEIADSFTDFERAIRRKLIREVTPIVIGTRSAPEPQG